MKKHLFLTALLPLVLLSCGNDPAPETEAPAETGDTSIVSHAFDFDTLRGMYAGNFGGPELRLVITYASEGHATGFNSVKGLQRNISGKVTPKGQTIELELAEPGDHPNDGVFHLSVNRETLDMTGTWKPNDPKLKAKSFRLGRIVRPEDESELTAGTFANHFYSVNDSLGRIYFQSNGLCSYEYLNGAADDEITQTESFSGTWSYRSGRLTIEWEENPVFPSRKSSFIPFLHENEPPQLIGEGRELETDIW